jgi:hypothetical protein
MLLLLLLLMLLMLLLLLPAGLSKVDLNGCHLRARTHSLTHSV